MSKLTLQEVPTRAGDRGLLVVAPYYRPYGDGVSLFQSEHVETEQSTPAARDLYTAVWATRTMKPNRCPQPPQTRSQPRSSSLAVTGGERHWALRWREIGPTLYGIPRTCPLLPSVRCVLRLARFTGSWCRCGGAEHGTVGCCPWTPTSAGCRCTIWPPPTSTSSPTPWAGCSTTSDSTPCCATWNRLSGRSCSRTPRASAPPGQKPLPQSALPTLSPSANASAERPNDSPRNRPAARRSGRTNGSTQDSLPVIMKAGTER